MVKTKKQRVIYLNGLLFKRDGTLECPFCYNSVEKKLEFTHIKNPYTFICKHCDLIIVIEKSED